MHYSPNTNVTLINKQPYQLVLKPFESVQKTGRPAFRSLAPVCNMFCSVHSHHGHSQGRFSGRGCWDISPMSVYPSYIQVQGHGKVIWTVITNMTETEQSAVCSTCWLTLSAPTSYLAVRTRRWLGTGCQVGYLFSR